jgi:hypothetical protein
MHAASSRSAGVRNPQHWRRNLGVHSGALCNRTRDHPTKGPGGPLRNPSCESSAVGSPQAVFAARLVATGRTLMTLSYRNVVLAAAMHTRLPRCVIRAGIWPSARGRRVTGRSPRREAYSRSMQESGGGGTPPTRSAKRHSRYFRHLGPTAVHAPLSDIQTHCGC